MRAELDYEELNDSVEHWLVADGSMREFGHGWLPVNRGCCHQTYLDKLVRNRVEIPEADVVLARHWHGDCFLQYWEFLSLSDEVDAVDQYRAFWPEDYPGHTVHWRFEFKDGELVRSWIPGLEQYEPCYQQALVEELEQRKMHLLGGLLTAEVVEPGLKEELRRRFKEGYER